MRADFSFAKSDVMHAAFYGIKERLLARLLFLLDKRDLFKEVAIILEALSETTKGDADRVVMNPTGQSPKFFEAQPTADSADKKSGLACTGAASR